MMDARITLVTLGVSDLQRSARFYEALGWRRTEAGNESVVFLQGEGIVLSLFGTASLAEDAGLPLEEPLPRFRGITLAINLADEAATDRLYAAALQAGGTGVKPPEKVFWGGYSGYFADPDGHLWEIAHNPFFAMDARGHLDLMPTATDATGLISPLEGEMPAGRGGSASADLLEAGAAPPSGLPPISPSRGEIAALGESGSSARSAETDDAASPADGASETISHTTERGA